MHTLVFVGLGNPGPAYAKTRHNLGSLVLQAWVEKTQQALGQDTAWQPRATYTRLELAIPVEPAGSTRVHCLFPLTFMNKSGEAIRDYLRQEHLPSRCLLVLHDDIELPAGQVRVQRGGSAKGHNGLRSIYQALQTQDVARLRLGIGRPREEPVDEYVLDQFTAAQAPLLEEITAKASTILDRICREGIRTVIT